ncbi:MAG: DUF3052 family protein [Gammaproteobacteria bacterium]|nr:DUF3052 family protein [Gammaproteobacteria bacterium]
MAGYSDTPLVKKLGIRDGMKVQFVQPPANYRALLGKLPSGVTVCQRARKDLDFIHGFVTRRADLERLLERAHTYMAKNGMLWVSWPKKASGVRTDVAEADVRAAGLACGLVDVKICAVDATWSGLKFVYRLKDR